jgi:histidine phosphotransferase ChpT
MADAALMNDLELAALMCSKLCHDVIGPVGAVSNGFEILEDETDEAMRQMALDLIRNNAEKASAQLQFLRLAFGAMGGAGDLFPLEDARRLTESLYAREKAKIRWGIEPESLPKDQVKLLVNLVVVAASTIPRGGEVDVGMSRSGDRVGFQLKAVGSHASLPESIRLIFAGEAPLDGLDARSVQSYYAYRLARSLGMSLKATPGEESVEIAAEQLQ